MKEITEKEAKEIIAQVRQEKLTQCQGELNTLLAKHGCQLSCQLGIVDGRIVGAVTLTERPN